MPVTGIFIPLNAELKNAFDRAVERKSRGNPPPVTPNAGLRAAYVRQLMREFAFTAKDADWTVPHELGPFHAETDGRKATEAQTESNAKQCVVKVRP